MESANRSTQHLQSFKEATPAAVQRPELLMAALEGDWCKLNDLLGGEDAPEPGVVVDIHTTCATAGTIIAHLGKPPHPAETLDLGEESILLHVVASSGEREGYLKCATLVYDKAKHLLDTSNSKGDTPLHCAVRAGRVKMLSHLIALARAEAGGHARVEKVLRKQNKQGETVLHEALRLADKKMIKVMVDVLLSADAELARFCPSNGASPLYLAVLLGHDDIAEHLHRNDKNLSYSGPDGQNALHVAVLRSEDMTQKLLKWNKDLTKQRDQLTGSTPLHIASSWGKEKSKVVRLLLDADKSSAFQHDNRGLFPIHVAAKRTLFSVVRILLQTCPSCYRLQDAEGKTFLHIAVQMERSFVVGYACWQQRFALIWNMQDYEGNTALHLAAEIGNQWSFYCLIQNPQIQLNLLNNKGQTPLDIAWINKPHGVVYALDPKYRIYLLLNGAGAKTGTYRWDDSYHVDPKIDVKVEEKKISDSAQVIAIGSVLIVTVACAATFTIPGGFRADDKTASGKTFLAGTAVLGRNIFFDVFIIANTLALVCSGVATANVMFAGAPTVDIRTRMSAFLISIVFLYCSAKSLVVAFIFGLYAVLAPPVAPVAAYISCAIAGPLLCLDIFLVILILAIAEVMLLKRMGLNAWLLSFSLSRVPNIINPMYNVLTTPLHPTKTDGPVSRITGSG